MAGGLSSEEEGRQQQKQQRRGDRRDEKGDKAKRASAEQEISIEMTPPSAEDIRRNEETITKLQKEILSGTSTDAIAVAMGKLEEEEAAIPLSPKAVFQKLKENAGIFIFLIVLVALLILAGVLLWEPMSWQAWYSIVVVVLVLTLLLKSFFAPHFVVLMGLAVLMVAQILPVNRALMGFSNSGLISIALLFVIAKTIEVNKVVDLITKYLLRRPTAIWDAQLRLMLPVGLLSAFMNNTPIVAMLIPAVEGWSQAGNLPRSKLLIPLSYAAILGGTCTLIGTSTNLVVATLAKEKNPEVVLGFFEVGYVGFPLLFVGILYVVVFSRWFLPVRESGTARFINNPREYSMAVVVGKKSSVVGKTIERVKLNKLHGVSLFQIERQGEFLLAPRATTELQAEDVLFFSGLFTDMEQVFTFDDFYPASAEQLEKIAGKKGNRTLVELVVASHSPLIGHTVRKSHFRSRYNAAIIAVHRRGQRLQERVADTVLEAGDVLLAEANHTFLKYHSHDQDFALVNELTRSRLGGKVNPFKIVFVLVLTAAMVIVSSADVVDLVAAALLVGCIFILTGCITLEEALESINGEILLLIACAFGLGAALEVTGASETIASSVLKVLSQGGNVAMLFGIYIITAILSSVISNAATVTLMFPICYEFVTLANLPFKAMVYTLMLAGSSCFATPIGYQTNLMVMGPGGYTFMDYVKFGVPLTVILMCLTVGLSLAVYT